MGALAPLHPRTRRARARTRMAPLASNRDTSDGNVLRPEEGGVARGESMGNKPRGALAYAHDSSPLPELHRTARSDAQGSSATPGLHAPGNAVFARLAQRSAVSVPSETLPTEPTESCGNNNFSDWRGSSKASTSRTNEPVRPCRGGNGFRQREQPLLRARNGRTERAFQCRQAL